MEIGIIPLDSKRANDSYNLGYAIGYGYSITSISPLWETFPPYDQFYSMGLEDGVADSLLDEYLTHPWPPGQLFEFSLGEAIPLVVPGIIMAGFGDDYVFDPRRVLPTKRHWIAIEANLASSDWKWTLLPLL